MTREEKLNQLAALRNPAMAAFSHIQSLKGEPGHTPTDEELLKLIRPLIPKPVSIKGDPGHTPTDEELLALIRPLIPTVKDGKTPSTADLVALILPLIPQPVPGPKPTKKEIEGIILPLIPKPVDSRQLISDTIKEIISGKKMTVDDISGVAELKEFLRRGGYRGGGGSSTSGGTGTVTTVSVVTANGFTGTVANPTTTPAITIATSVTGLLKGNGTAISAASAGTDYQAPIALTTTGTSGAATFLANTLNIPNYSSGSGGITRSIFSVAINTSAGAAASTDYVYIVSGTTTITLPTTVGNTNLYTIKNVGAGVVTVATTGGETIDGSATASIPVQFTSYDFIATGGNWNVV